MAIFIHKTADVSRQSVIGEGTKVWNLAQVRKGVKIGEECVLGRGVYVDSNVMSGRTGAADDSGCYQGLVYIPINEENGFEAQIPKEPVDFLTGFIPDENGNEVYGRPVATTVAPDGSLLVNDDDGGVIWRVSAE